jgi:hypothetical protein
MSDFGNRDAHLQALETVKNSVGEQALGPHRGGYLSQDEYATRIYYWAGEEHESDEIEGVISTLANASWARVESEVLAVGAVVLAFCELYREKELPWRAAYPVLFQRVRKALDTLHDSAAWNAFHVAQWFVLRRARKEEGVEILDKLLDRIAAGGKMRYDTLEALNHWAKQCKPFEIAWQRAAQKRQEQMVVKVQ